METKRKKNGGRQKGVPNKTSKELKDFIKQFISDNLDTMQADFKSKRMHPRDRLTFIEKLLKYVVPVINNSKATLDIKADLEKLTESQLEQIIQRLTEKQIDDDEE